jgi:hypothetical protein
LDKSIHNQIIDKVKEGKKGRLLFPSDFNSFGSDLAIRKALSRLVQTGLLKRLAVGIYLYPKQHLLLGTLYPSTEEIAAQIAQRDKAKIIPTGAAAMHKLGLSTQVPMKITYLTDGAPRKIKVGKHTITFKGTTAKKLAAKGPISSLVIQALEGLGKDATTKVVLDKINVVLKREEEKFIRHDASVAPAWIAKILYQHLLTRKK